MSTVHRPAAEWELASLLADASRRSSPMTVAGGGTKSGVGRPPVAGAATISMASLKGIPLYEPSELVMSCLAGTPLAEIEALLAQRGQMLAFEPIDVGPALGKPARAGSIGAVFATNLSGARRIAAGAARDNLLGLKAVAGSGEAFKSGGRVMKNVTGYDLARAFTGSWGTLAVATEVTFKVLPRPEASASLVIFGLPDEIAVEMMTTALGTPYEVSGTVHLPVEMVKRLKSANLKSIGKAVTAVRLEGFERFLPARIEKLKAILAPLGDVHVLAHEVSAPLWMELNELSVVAGVPSPLWRLSVPPLQGPKVVAAIGKHMPVEAFYDWSGGLVWLLVPGAADAGASDIRRIIARTQGHATLIRADESVRRAVEVFQPLDAGLDRITRALKATFDPAGILNPGRMYAAM